MRCMCLTVGDRTILLSAQQVRVQPDMLEVVRPNLGSSRCYDRQIYARILQEITDKRK